MSAQHVLTLSIEQTGGDRRLVLSSVGYGCLQGGRIVQRYIDHRKLQRLMKDISSFTASQRMNDVPAVMQVDAKQVPSVSWCAGTAGRQPGLRLNLPSAQASVANHRSLRTPSHACMPQEPES